MNWGNAYASKGASEVSRRSCQPLVGSSEAFALAAVRTAAAAAVHDRPRGEDRPGPARHVLPAGHVPFFSFLSVILFFLPFSFSFFSVILVLVPVFYLSVRPLSPATASAADGAYGFSRLQLPLMPRLESFTATARSTRHLASSFLFSFLLGFHPYKTIFSN